MFFFYFISVFLNEIKIRRKKFVDYENLMKSIDWNHNNTEECP